MLSHCGRLALCEEWLELLMKISEEECQGGSWAEGPQSLLFTFISKPRGEMDIMRGQPTCLCVCVTLCMCKCHKCCSSACASFTWVVQTYWLLLELRIRNRGLHAQQTWSQLWRLKIQFPWRWDSSFPMPCSFFHCNHWASIWFKAISFCRSRHVMNWQVWWSRWKTMRLIMAAKGKCWDEWWGCSWYFLFMLLA